MSINFEQSSHISENFITKETPRSLEIKEVIFNVENAFIKLGITNWEIPEGVSINYVSAKEDKPVLGRVLCYSDTDIRIEYDDRFKDLESEKKLLEKYCPQYPGLQKTLVHELAHIAMWSLIGELRQPATRLLDEGFARLIEDLSYENVSIQSLKNDSKKFLVEKYTSGDSNFQKAMNIGTVTTGVSLGNGAEHAVGKAILLWILESKGSDAMISLLKNSPARGKNILYGFEPNNILAGTQESKLKEILSRSDNSIETGIWEDETLIDWETNQFHKAIIEVTGLSNIAEAEDVFKNWIIS